MKFLGSGSQGVEAIVDGVTEVSEGGVVAVGQAALFDQLPQAFDKVEIGAVGGQVEQESVVIDQPALSRCFIEAVMDAGIVQHDHGWPAVAGSEQVIDEALDMRTFDRARMGGMNQRIGAEIQRADHAAPAVMVGLDLVRQTPW